MDKTQSELRRRAIELLANEYERDGWKGPANDLRNGISGAAEERSIRAVVAALSARATPPLATADREGFQARVQPWMMECFGEKISADRVERGDRFLEEALELLQSGGYDRERIKALVDYVWNRPAGEPSQEVGGVMVTLAAYCLAHDLNMHAAGETELARINQPEIVEKIRAKQAAKAQNIPFSPLPVAPTPAASDLREKIAMAMADGFSNGNEQFNEASPPQQARYLAATDAILSLIEQSAAGNGSCSEIAGQSEPSSREKRLEEALLEIVGKWITNKNEGEDWEEGYDDGLKAAHDIAFAALESHKL